MSHRSLKLIVVAMVVMILAASIAGGTVRYKWGDDGTSYGGTTKQR